jgi:uncharacterized repeat protein (TIGR03803 family)
MMSNSVLRVFLQPRRIELGLAFMFLSAACSSQCAQAQTYKILHEFQGNSDGGLTYAGVIRDAQGNIYGTTPTGGTYGEGSVFKIGEAGKETMLYSFKGGNDGADPYQGLMEAADGNLYGTTSGGGAAGGGIVFKLSKSGKETVLYTFKGSGDAYNPLAGVIRDARGNLYGTTQGGGTFNAGAVFQLSKSGKETVLYSFKGGTDGNLPDAGVMQDSKGNLYGTTLFGGAYDAGVVFKLSKTGNETILYSFTNGTDGGYPYAGVVGDGKGNLYGTTGGGGTYGGGTVFKVTQNGAETVLYSFGGGSMPYAGLIRDSKGNLYGTTFYGQTVFKVDTSGTETVLHSFCQQSGCADGGYPVAGVFRDTKGHLYGTTLWGGDLNCNPSYGCGVVFELTP